MIAKAGFTDPDPERQLLERAISTLVCAVAFDEAFQTGAGREELEALRGHWAPDAQRIVEEAERMGLLDDGLDDDDDFDDTEEEDDD